MRTANSSSYAAARELRFFFVGWVDDDDEDVAEESGPGRISLRFVSFLTLPLLLA
jgi:hypothetical protein